MKKINHRNALIIFLIGITLFMKGISAIDIQWDLTNDKHYTLSDNTIKIIEELGGKQRMEKVRKYYPGEKPYRMVYMEDPFGNIFELYSHSYELTYSAGAYV